MRIAEDGTSKGAADMTVGTVKEAQEVLNLYGVKLMRKRVKVTVALSKV
jgi:hypothetical protein